MFLADNEVLYTNFGHTDWNIPLSSLHKSVTTSDLRKFEL